MIRPTVHTNRSRKQSFSKTFFKPEEFEHADFSVDGAELFENEPNQPKKAGPGMPPLLYVGALTLLLIMPVYTISYNDTIFFCRTL